MAQTQFTVRGGVKTVFNRDGRRFKVGVLSEAPQLNLRFSSVRTTAYANSSPVGKWKEFPDEVWDDEETDELATFRGLVLDISYRPVNVVCWKRAICLEFAEKADVLEYYDQTVNSPSGSYFIPAVLRVPHLLQVVKRRRIKKALSRKNIFYRDNYTCQYCSSDENLTIDHVLPIAHGGEWTWENLVTACSRCNSRKGHKTPEEANMKLMKVPKDLTDRDKLVSHTLKCVFLDFSRLQKKKKNVIASLPILISTLCHHILPFFRPDPFTYHLLQIYTTVLPAQLFGNHPNILESSPSTLSLLTSSSPPTPASPAQQPLRAYHCRHLPAPTMVDSHHVPLLAPVADPSPHASPPIDVWKGT